MSPIVLLLLGASAAGADIYKCEDPEGNVAYLQTPCPIEKKESVEPVIEPDPEKIESVPETPEAEYRTQEEIEACKEPLRNSIDEIEAAMLRGYTSAEGEEFKKKLRTLTQAMRACG